VPSVESAFGACALNPQPKGWGTSLVSIARLGVKIFASAGAGSILVARAGKRVGLLRPRPWSIISFDSSRIAPWSCSADCRLGIVIRRFRHPGIVDKRFDRASKTHANGSLYEIGTCRVIKSPRLHTRSSFLLMWIGSGRRSREQYRRGSLHRMARTNTAIVLACAQAKTTSRARPSRQQSKPTARHSRFDESRARFTRLATVGRLARRAVSRPARNKHGRKPCDCPGHCLLLRPGRCRGWSGTLS
jgi:hypothetical protein